MNLRSFIVAGVIAAVLIVTPTPSSAATVAQLQAQLNALLAQLAALQSQQGNSSDEDDADDAIDAAEDAIDAAEDAIDDSDASHSDLDDAEELLDEAYDFLEEAEDAFDDEDYDDAIDAAEDAIDAAEEAEDIAQENGNDEDEDEADDRIQEAEDAVDDARDAIDDSDASNSDLNEADDLIEEAEDLIDDADEAFDDEDYDDAIDLADEAIDRAEEAEDLANNESDEDERDAEEAIEEAEDAVHDANQALDDSNASGSDQNEAEDLIEDAEVLIDEAWDAFDDKDYDDAVDRAEEAIEKAEEAEDLAGDGNVDGNPNDVCIILTRNLSLGASGDDVSTLQRFLGVGATGYFGSATKSALIAWQSYVGLTPSGAVDVITRAKINGVSTSTSCDDDDRDEHVSFHAGSFSTRTPTLTGTAFGVTSFGISVAKGGDKAYGSGAGAVKVVDGKWSHKITTSLLDGSYTVRAFDSSNTEIGSGGFSVYATATSTAKGTYIGYLNGSQFIRTENISKADALANCKLNASNNPTKSIRCTWNGEEIYAKTVATGVGPAIASFTATPGGVMRGNPSKLAWTVTNADSCTLSYGTVKETVALIDTKTVTPNTSTSYTLACMGTVGTGLNARPSAVAKVITVAVAVATTAHTQQASVLTAFETQLAELTAQVQALLGN